MSLREKRVSIQLRVRWQPRCDPHTAKITPSIEVSIATVPTGALTLLLQEMAAKALPCAVFPLTWLNERNPMDTIRFLVQEALPTPDRTEKIVTD